MEAAHPEGYTVKGWGGEGEGGKIGVFGGCPKICIFARALIGLNAVSHRFVVPLGPDPPDPPSSPRTPQWPFQNFLKNL